MPSTGRMEENATTSEYKEHKVVTLNVNVKENIVTMVTEGDNSRAKHSMTINDACTKGFLDFGKLNKVLI